MSKESLVKTMNPVGKHGLVSYYYYFEDFGTGSQPVIYVGSSL